MSQEIIEGIRTIEKEKGIETGTLIAALEDALLAAYKKTPGAARHATVELDDEGEFRVFALDIPSDLEERLVEEARERAIDDLEKIEEETGEKQHTLILDDELNLDWEQVPDHLVNRTDATPDDFGRIAAMTAKQVIQQRIREAERAIMYEEYVDRQGEVVTGIVQQAGDRNNVLVDLGKVEALLPRSEQVDGERYEQGSRIKAVIIEVRSGTKGPQVILSRRAPQLIEALFELEVPEIADGLVEIRGVAREPGYRSKIAVESHVQGVDPVGACVGPRGSRVRMVVSELRGEKIDIIPWNTEPARFVAKALSPARVREVYIDDESRDATVVVPDDQLALAIGKEGLNARLAARLTGWKVDIKSDTEFAQEEAAGRLRGRGRRRRRLLRPLLRNPLERQAVPERVAPRHEVLRRPVAPGARERPDRRLASWPTRRTSTRRGGAGVRSVEAGEPIRASRPSQPRVPSPSRPTRRSKAKRPRRHATTRDPTGPDTDLRRLRQPRAEAGARALCGGGRRADCRPRSPRARRVHVRELTCFEQADERRAFARRLRTAVVVEPALVRLYTEESHG